MMKFNNIRSVFLATGVTLWLCFFSSNNVFAATYTTETGDSLYKIGQLFNISTTNLITDNKLSSTSIYPGQALYVSCRTYTVQNSDSLFLIARKFNVTLTNLRKANNLWIDSLNVGQVLNLPYTTVSNGIPYSASDVDVLSRLIMAEAQGEPYNGKVAVGAVVVNRVKSGSFANSVYNVIYQTINGYYQFTPVLNGWINKPADADSIKAATNALNGLDPTNGALFYFDDSTTNKWLWSKTISITIDKLVFAY